MTQRQRLAAHILHRLPFLVASEGRPCLARLLTGGPCPHGKGATEHLPCELSDFWGANNAILWLRRNQPERITFLTDCLYFTRLANLCRRLGLEAEAVAVGVGQTVISLRQATNPERIHDNDR